MTKLIREIRVGDLVYLKDEFSDYTPDSAGGPVEITKVDIAYADYSFIDSGVRGKFFYGLHHEWRVLEFQLENVDMDKTNASFRGLAFKQSLTLPTLPEL
jgi:hypothetical protein